MKKIYYLIIPIIIISGFSIFTKKKALYSKIDRKFVSQKLITAFDTLYVNSEIDGMSLDQNNIWVNKRYSITGYTDDHKLIREIKLPPSEMNSQIVNLDVHNDSLFYINGSNRFLRFYDLKNNQLKKDLPFNFPFAYFVKTKKMSFLFQETILGTSAAQLHYTDLSEKETILYKYTLLNAPGSSMRYSGSFIRSISNDEIAFVPYYEDSIYLLDYKGKLVLKFKTIDAQDQDLSIVKEDNRFFLNPKASILREAACIYKNQIFISSYIQDHSQTLKESEDNLMIDVYNEAKGTYKFSFYLPNYLKGKAKLIQINARDQMVVAYNSVIISYDLSKIVGYEG